MRNRFIGFGLATIIGVGVFAMPSMASAQFWHHRNHSHSEDGARANAIALGAAGVILMSGHQNTLGEIALGAAALQAIQMQNDIDNRHDRHYGRYGRWDDRDRDDRWRDRDRDRYRDRDRDRDRDRRHWSF